MRRFVPILGVPLILFLATCREVPAAPSGDERIHAPSDMRDSARRLDNFYLGAGLSGAFFFNGAFTDTGTTEIAPVVDFQFGYRSHFSRRLGGRLGGLLRIAPGPHFHQLGPDSVVEGGHAYLRRIDGDGYLLTGVQLRGQIIFGPFHRFALEPGLALGYNWNFPGTVKPYEGTRSITPVSRFSTVAVILGASLYLGSRDQWNPTGFISVGGMPGSAGGVDIEGGAGLTFATTFFQGVAR